jgi:hypothetical protein
LASAKVAALQYKVARIIAQSPSIDVARKELRREGIVLDKKAVRRIAEQWGHQLLELRRRELFAWREGWLPAGTTASAAASSIECASRWKSSPGSSTNAGPTSPSEFATPAWSGLRGTRARRDDSRCKAV